MRNRHYAMTHGAALLPAQREEPHTHRRGCANRRRAERSPVRRDQGREVERRCYALARRAALSLFVPLVPLACGGEAGAGSTGMPDGGAAGREAIRIVVVTHGQASDPFWSVVANGIEDAARDLGVQVEYQAPTSFDMVRMSQLIDAAVASRPSGLVVSIPDADALHASIRAAVAAGIATLSINSGAASYEELGLLAHIGQTEYEAGFASGERLAAAGVSRVLCINHEIGNLALDARCRGLGDAIAGSGGTMRTLAVDLADPADAQQRVAGALAADPQIDGLLTLGPAGAVPTLAALRETGRAGDVAFATFDLTPEVLRAVQDGEMLFAIDQQPYLQGYLPIVFLTKYLETRTMPGGGQVIRTGPTFVTAAEAGQVIELAERGVR